MVSSGIISKIAGRIIIPMAIIPTVLTPSKNVKNHIMMPIIPIVVLFS